MGFWNSDAFINTKMKHMSEAIATPEAHSAPMAFNMGSELVWESGDREDSLVEVAQEPAPEGAS